MTWRRIALAIAATSLTDERPTGPTGDAGGTYTYPPAAAAIPSLRRWIDRDAARRDDVVTKPTTVRQEHPLGTEDWRVEQWQVVADTSRFLSLSQVTTESGGAHPLVYSDALVRDKVAAAPQPVLSFFSSTAVFVAAVRDAFCRRLRVERRRKRGGDNGDFGPWRDCVDPAKAVVMPGSSGGGRFDRIGFRMDPYEAGPYAEGTYEVTLPVTPAILAAVKPEWRRYFAVAGTP